ncbi:MAG: UDP-N-acetylmuramoyl-tripeptide--D-alanyl-D-alanine ligase [Lachnospiraceae bacterium]|nr:UDP-N-acetylmuramoyl-tripeptide--D-alanyl-D-alanine ligase [Lachnospiraceae bacterium]
MKNITLENLARVTGGRLVHPEHENCGIEAGGVYLDSRQVQAGDIFIATKGERVDGHSFIPAVAEKGALGVICEKEQTELTLPYIIVEDSFTALRQIGEFYRAQLNVKVVGITGSVGKTSTKEFIAGVLAQKYKVLKTQGNFNNEIGVPLTILRIRDEHEVAVLEMGINHFGEMSRLTQMAKPDVCVMTNIGQCHLEFLGSREGILKAKSEIFECSNPEGIVVVNGDDDMLQTISQVHGKTPVRFGLCGEHGVSASDVKNLGLFGSEFTVHLGEKAFTAKVNLPGEHQIYNALAAAAVADYLGLTEEEIVKGIASVTPTAGRSNLIQTADFVLIDDCYNANPVSMKAAIALLSTAATRKVAILGDMFELGEREREMHGEIGAYVVEKGIDVLLCAGELSEEMAARAGAKSSATKVYHYATRELLVEDLQRQLVKGDTVLIKASHGMGYQNIVELLM